MARASVLDVRDFIVHEGDLVAYPRGLGSHGVEMVLAVVLEIDPEGLEGWGGKRFPKVKVAPEGGGRAVWITKTRNLVLLES